MFLIVAARVREDVEDDIEELRLTQYWTAFRRGVWGVYTHGGLGCAKGAAYSALLAFLPVLTVTTTLLVQANAAAVSRKIVAFLFQVAPPGVEELIRYAVTERGARPAALPVVAAILATWAASGVTTSLMEAFQAAYRRKSSRGIVRNRIVAMWLVLASIVPVVGASTLLIFGERAETWALTRLGLLEAGEGLMGGVLIISHAARYGLAFAAIVCVTALMYYFGPDAGRGRQIWPGAVLAATLWLGITQVFAWYVRHVAKLNVLYGTIGAVMALMLWMYLLSLSAMVGCEFNARFEEGNRRRR